MRERSPETSSAGSANLFRLNQNVLPAGDEVEVAF